jgi:hypothetical protein
MIPSLISLLGVGQREPGEGGVWLGRGTYEGEHTRASRRRRAMRGRAGEGEQEEGEQEKVSRRRNRRE